MNEIQTIDSVSGKYMLMKHSGVIIKDLGEEQLKQMCTAGVINAEDALSDDGGQTWHSCADVILIHDKSYNQHLEEQRVEQNTIQYEQQEAADFEWTAAGVAGVIALLLFFIILANE